MSVIDNLEGMLSGLEASISHLFSANEARFLLTLKNCQEPVQVVRFRAEEALNTP